MMTDNETKKALECCINCGVNCKECPYDSVHTESKWCDEALMEDALDLINRLEAENNKLTSLCTSKDVIINSQEAEIERMREISEALDIEHEAIKNCAVKEFAEKAKEELAEWVGADNSITYSRIERVLDNLAKETVGE